MAREKANAPPLRILTLRVLKSMSAEEGEETGGEDATDNPGATLSRLRPEILAESVFGFRIHLVRMEP